MSLTLLSPVILFFNRSLRGILPRFSRPPIGCYTDDSIHCVLIDGQLQARKYVDVDTHKIICFFFTYWIKCSSALRRRTMDTWGRNGAWTRWPHWQKVQNKRDKDWMHNYQDKGTCDGYLNVSVRRKLNVKIQQTTSRW